MNCPHCGRELHPVENQKFCSFCGKPLDAPDTQTTDSGTDLPRVDISTEPEPSGEAPSIRDEYCPWEDQEELGFASGIYLTVRESLFNPKEFFARLPLKGGFMMPLLYALIVETLGTMIGYLWGFAMGTPLFGHENLGGNRAIIFGVLIPMLVFLGIVIWAVTLHVGLFLVGGAKEDFEATFRVACYASAPELINVVPVVGSFIGLFWRLYLTVVGLSQVHGTSTGKSILALILPVIVCCGVIFGAAALIGLSVGLATP
ncbi:MAG: YIP1 family protein [Thermodesulfobacteriota bacterium]